MLKHILGLQLFISKSWSSSINWLWGKKKNERMKNVTRSLGFSKILTWYVLRCRNGLNSFLILIKWGTFSNLSLESAEFLLLFVDVKMYNSCIRMLSSSYVYCTKDKILEAYLLLRKCKERHKKSDRELFVCCESVLTTLYEYICTYKCVFVF